MTYVLLVKNYNTFVPLNQAFLTKTLKLAGHVHSLLFEATTLDLKISSVWSNLKQIV